MCWLLTDMVVVSVNGQCGWSQWGCRSLMWVVEVGLSMQVIEVGLLMQMVEIRWSTRMVEVVLSSIDAGSSSCLINVGGRSGWAVTWWPCHC